MKVRDLIDHLRRCHSREDIIAASLWTAEDVMRRALEDGIAITKEQAEAVLDEAEDRHDANFGISWDVLDVHIATILYLDRQMEDYASRE